MRKLVIIVIDAALLVVAVTSLWSAWANRNAVARAKADAATLAAQRDSLALVVRDNERDHARLAAQRTRHASLATTLLDSVAAWEKRRAESQLTVREIRTVGALQDRLRGAFPELGDTAWGLTTIPLDRADTVGIEYLTVPAWFAETFIIDHANAESWRVQKDQLLGVDSLRVVVTALQDSVTALATASAEAYRNGYQSAYAGYQDLSKRYVAALKKPRIPLVQAFGLIAAAGAGVVIGRSSR